MEYRLNKLKEKTTNHFKVNDLVVDLDIPPYHTESNHHLKGNVTKIKIESKIKKDTLKTRIGLEFKEYLELLITVPKNVKVEEPIQIDYELKEEDALIDKIKIQYEASSSCDFILKYHQKDKKKAFHHLYEEVIAEKNAKGSITLLNETEEETLNFMAVEVKGKSLSNITHNIIDLGGALRVYNLYGELEQNATHTLNNIYLGEKNEKIDMNYHVKNIGKSSNSQIKVEGAIKDNCEKVFRGIIDFVRGCKNAIGEENENCLLLSNTCKSRSLPEMLCGEEEVEGTHGVSSGKMEENKLFYLMSRGYTKEEAEKLIVLSRFYKIIEEVPEDAVKEEIIKVLEEKLNG